MTPICVGVIWWKTVVFIARSQFLKERGNALQTTKTQEIITGKRVKSQLVYANLSGLSFHLVFPTGHMDHARLHKPAATE